jgi:hypothetical protein
MDNEATLTRNTIRLNSDSAFHIKTWYSTPSIFCKDYEVFVESEEIKTQSKLDLCLEDSPSKTENTMMRQLLQ